MLKRILLLCLGLLLCFPLVSCDSEEGLTSQEIEAIIEGVGDSEFNACTFDMNIEATVGANIGGQNIQIELDGGGEGAVDNSDNNQAMHMPLDLTATVPLFGEQPISAEIYIVDGWVYMNTDSGWTKMELPEQVMEEQAQSLLIGQLIDLLALTDIEDAGSGSVDTAEGTIDCNKLHMEPDLGELAEAVLQQFQLTEIGGIDLSGLDDIASSLTVDCTFWIAEDDYQLMRINCDIDGEISSEDIPDIGDVDFGNITVDVTLDIVFDYSKDVDIVLPTEASQAETGDFELPFSLPFM